MRARGVSHAIDSVTRLARAAFALLLLAGCATGGSSGAGIVTVKVARSAPDTAAGDVVARAIAAFGADLLAAAGRPGENLVLSPYSVAVALAMTRAGAAGATGAEMDRVLHLANGIDPHAGFNALDQALRGRNRRIDEHTAVVLRFANAVWAQRGLPIERPFLETLSRSYGAGLRVADFETHAEAARRAVNAWVADETRDLIPELIPAGVITDLTRLVLVNALYLNAPWATPFDKTKTADGTFHAPGGAVTKPFLHGRAEGSYARGDGYQAVGLPYAGGDLRLDVVLPDAGRFADVAARLGDGLLADVGTAYRTYDVTIALPKLRLRSALPLKDTLVGLGLQLACSDAADFSGITRAEPLQITDVVHEAVVTLDEKGIEAAAATAVVVGKVSLPGPSVSVTVDRPFLFAVTDVATGVPLFLGRVLTPV